MRFDLVLVAGAALAATGAAIAPHAAHATHGTAPSRVAAQDSSAPKPSFEKKEVQIAMRDGAHLHTLIFTPKRAAGDLPILISRTPYGIEGMDQALASPSLKYLERDGYIFVFQDIRGRFTSEGQFVMLRPMRDKSKSKAIDESTGRVRHDRLADQERAAQQRPRRHAGHVVPWLAHRDGDARSASGAQGGVSARVASRHVHRRRLPSQRRVPAELRLRVRDDDGDHQGDVRVQVRSAGHVRLVSQARIARARE